MSLMQIYRLRYLNIFREIDVALTVLTLFMPHDAVLTRYTIYLQGVAIPLGSRAIALIKRSRS